MYKTIKKAGTYTGLSLITAFMAVAGLVTGNEIGVAAAARDFAENLDGDNLAAGLVAFSSLAFAIYISGIKKTTAAVFAASSISMGIMSYHSEANDTPHPLLKHIPAEYVLDKINESLQPK